MASAWVFETNNFRMRSVPRSPTPRWPFWLLIAAWVCANSPQAATYAVLTWLAEARSFSHQKQLTFDVAHLLAGEKSPSHHAVGAVAGNEDQPAPPLSPIPDAAVLKKLDLSSETAGILPRPVVARVRRNSAGDWRGDTLRAPPPHGPPRGRTIF